MQEAEAVADSTPNHPLTDEFGPDGPSLWTLWTRLVRLDERTISQAKQIQQVAQDVERLHRSMDQAQRTLRNTAYAVLAMAVSTFVGLLGLGLFRGG